MNYLKNIAVLIGFFAICVGCSTNREYARFDPGMDISPSAVIYVERDVDDRRELDKLIADNLSARGLSATSGLKESIPDSATVLVTYVDKWYWDITLFMIELTITLRDPSTRAAFAVATSYHSSISRLNRVEMIEEVLSNLIEADNIPGGLIQKEYD